MVFLIFQRKVKDERPSDILGDSDRRIPVDTAIPLDKELPKKEEDQIERLRKVAERIEKQEEEIE